MIVQLNKLNKQLFRFGIINTQRDGLLPWPVTCKISTHMEMIVTLKKRTTIAKCSTFLLEFKHESLITQEFHDETDRQRVKLILFMLAIETVLVGLLSSQGPEKVERRFDLFTISSANIENLQIQK